MSDWAAIETAIPDAIKAIRGRKFDVGWAERRARWRDDLHCKLRLVSLTNLGRTENRRTDNNDGTFTERTYSPARLIIQFTVISHEQSLANCAMPVAQEIAAALRRSDAFDILCAAGLGVSEVGPIVTSDFVNDKGRWLSSATFEVRFNTHVSAVTGFGRTGDYVEQAEVTGDVDGRPVNVLADAS